VALPHDSPLVSRTIGEVHVRKTTGTSIVGVIRQSEFHANPDAHFRFEADDLVAIIGMDVARQAFTRMAQAG
jgi:monovalent cation:H+ antiporter-2, CPA2 family